MPVVLGNFERCRHLGIVQSGTNPSPSLNRVAIDLDLKFALVKKKL